MHNATCGNTVTERGLIRDAANTKPAEASCGIPASRGRVQKLHRRRDKSLAACRGLTSERKHGENNS